MTDSRRAESRTHRRLALARLLVLATAAWTTALTPTTAATRRIDAMVERPGIYGGTKSAGVTVSTSADVTHGTPQSLVITWPRDLGDIAGTGTPKALQSLVAWMPVPPTLDLSRYTTLSFWARLDEARHGHVALVFNDSPYVTAKSYSTHVPLDAGDWSRYEVTLDLIEPSVRRTWGWLGFVYTNVGHLPDEPARVRTTIDDFVLSDTPSRPRRGWKADPSVVIVNQLGFLPHHEKTAFLDGEHVGRPFRVRNATNGRTVHSGRLQRITSAIGSHALADFTAVTASGRYVIEAADRQSLPFRIGRDAADSAIELLSDWVFGMRCGMATPLHPPCHLDDAVHVSEATDSSAGARTSVDLSGGWHDAGGVRTYYSYTYLVAHQALRAREAGWRRDRNRDGVDDLLDSAAWAMRHLPKVRSPDTGALLHKISDWPDYRRGNYWTDNVRGTADDRHVRISPEYVNQVGQAAASAGLFARTVGAGDPMAANALDVARERWAVWFDPERGKKPWRRKRLHVHGHGNHLATWGQGALQLYLATGDEEHREFARRCGWRIISYQRKTLYLGSNEPLTGEIFSWHRPLADRDLPEEFLADLMLELPDDDHSLRWRTALVKSAELWMKPTRSRWSPYSLPHLEVPAPDLPDGAFAVPLERDASGAITRHLVPTAGGDQLVDTAIALQRVAQALRDPELERLARRQVQWAFGRNPFNLSWVNGAGPDSLTQMYSFSQGRMPGSVAGFGIGRHGIPVCARPSGAEPVTRLGLKLMRALIAVTQPARFSFVLTRGEVPHEGSVSIYWLPPDDVARSSSDASSSSGGVPSVAMDEPVFSGRTDCEGHLSGIALDGGQHYELRAGGVRVPLTAISGTFSEERIDLDRVVVMSAKGPAAVDGSSPFTIDLTVENRGRQPVSVDVTAHVTGAMTRQATAAVDLRAGETTTLAWPFRSNAGGRPLIVHFEPDGDRRRIVDFAGIVRWPPPKTGAAR